MSIHRSLRTAGALARHRNVLSREERIKKLEDAGRWVEGKNPVLGLPKVKNIKVVGKKKSAAAKEKEAAAAAAGTAAPAAGAAAPAAAEGAKKDAAKPAASAKGEATKPAAGKKE